MHAGYHGQNSAFAAEQEKLFCMNVIAAKMQEIPKAGFRAS